MNKNVKQQLTKALNVFLVLLLIVPFFTTVAPNVSQAIVGFTGTGTGTVADPYIIETADQLNEVRNHLSSHFRLGNDVDLASFDHGDGKGWMPIGDFDNKFMGALDGAGYIISNLTIDRTGSMGAVALFSNTGFTSELKNIRLEGVKVTGDFVAGLVGINEGTITNSYSTGEVMAVSFLFLPSGGLVGYNAENGTITNSYSTGDVTGDIVGGLVGENGGSITNTYSTGELTGHFFSGGLVGINGNEGTITNSYTTGDIVGGQMGDNDVAGLVGSNSGTITNSSVKTHAEMKQKETFTNWDFDTVWSIEEGITYPTLQVFSTAIIDNEVPTITLTPSPTDWISGDVTVIVVVDATGSEVETIKLLEGTKDIADFANAGEVITDSFTADTNGTYTVYALDEAGNESVETITIENIDKEAPTITLTPSTHDWTNEDIDVSVLTDGTGSPIETVKMLKGNQTVDTTKTDGEELFSLQVEERHYSAAPEMPPGTKIAWSTMPVLKWNGLTYWAYSYIDNRGGMYIVAYDKNGNIVDEWERMGDRYLLNIYVDMENRTVSFRGQTYEAGHSQGINMTFDELNIDDNVYNFTASENGTYTVYAKDVAGNEVVETISIANIDREDPSISYSYDNSWTNEDVTISVNPDGTISPVAMMKWLAGEQDASAFMTDGEIITDSFVVSENGQYTIYVKDAVGNETTEVITITNIDKVKPVIEMDVTGTLGNENWYTSNATFSLTGSDNSSGVSITEYRLNGGEWTTYNGPVTLTDGEYNVEYQVKDVAGNVAIDSVVIKVDTTKPVTTATIDKQVNENGWYNENLLITLNVTETGSGVVYTEYRVNGSDWMMYVQPIFLQNGMNEISYRSVDIAGHTENTRTHMIEIDTLAPTLTLTENPTEPTNGLVEVIVAANGTGSAITTMKWAQGDLTAEDFTTQGTDINGTTFDVEENGTYSVYVKDQAGHETVRTIIIGNIDKLAPTINLTPSTTDWTNDDVTVTVDTNGTGSNIVIVKLLEGEKTVSDFASAGAEITTSFDVHVNGTYTVYAKDVAGNESVVTITVDSIDKETPTITLTPSTQDWTIGNVTVSVEADGTGSEVETIKLLEGTKEIVDFASAGEVITDSFTAEANGTYTVYAVDEAGNESVVTITVDNIDKEEPTITLTPSPTDWISGDVTVSVDVDGTGSGVVETKLLDGAKQISDFANAGEVITDFFTAEANGTYTVYAVDEAGNESVVTISVDNIDKEAPTIMLTPSTSDLTNEDISVTVLVDGTGSSVSEIKYLEGAKEIADFASAGEVIADSFTAETNGTYTVYAVDEAGNETVTTIDIRNIITIKNDEQDVEAEVSKDEAGNVLLKINGQTFTVTIEDDMQEMITSKSSINVETPTISLQIPAENLENESLQIIAEKIETIKDALNTYSFTILQESGEVSEFSSPVTLKFSINEADIEGVDTDKLKVYYLNEETNAWDLIGGTFENGVVTVDTNHFSTYAVFSKDPNKTELPNTATSYYNYILAGVLFLLAGLIVVAFARRRTV